MELDLEELVTEYFKGKANPIAPSPDLPNNRRVVRLSDPDCLVKSKSFLFFNLFKFEFADPAIRLPKDRGPKIGVPSNNRAAKGDNLRRTSRVAVS